MLEQLCHQEYTHIAHTYKKALNFINNQENAH